MSFAFKIHNVCLVSLDSVVAEYTGIPEPLCFHRNFYLFTIENLSQVFMARKYLTHN